MPLLLALDTSTAFASLALYDTSQVLAETSWLAGREHSTGLLTEARSALARVGRTPAELTGVVVARGPGSFTGVRVALSVGKGLAAGPGVPLWGIGSLEVLAYAAREVPLPVRPIIDAGRGRFATALYRDGACVEPLRGVSLQELAERDREPTLLIG